MRRAAASLLFVVTAVFVPSCNRALVQPAELKNVDAPSNAFENAPLGLTNADGPCLVLRNVRDRVIDGMTIGPCAGAGIEIWDSQNVTIRNARISSTVGAGVHIYGSSSVSIAESFIGDVSSGVYAVESTGVQVTCNTFEDPQGPMPRGQFVQFDKVRGGGNLISCNAGRSRLGQSSPEDAISLYESRGLPGQPITVAHNLIIGGGPSDSGGGIMLGDNGGAHQLAEHNVLIDPGQYGIGVASGQDMSIRDNVVFARRQSFTNVGIYVWNQYPHLCRAIAVVGNKVAWRSRTGESNPYWNADNCGVVVGQRDNDFNAPLTDDIADQSSQGACACKAAGRR